MVKPVIIPVTEGEVENRRIREMYEDLFANQHGNLWRHQNWKSINWSYRHQLNNFEKGINDHMSKAKTEAKRLLAISNPHTMRHLNTPKTIVLNQNPSNLQASMESQVTISSQQQKEQLQAGHEENTHSNTKRSTTSRSTKINTLTPAGKSSLNPTPI